MSNFCVESMHYKCDFTKTKVRVNNLVWDKTAIIFAIMNIDRDKGIEVTSSKYEFCRHRLLILLKENNFDNVEIIL